MLGVPAGLAGDRLDDVRVDLRQRVVAREGPEGVRQIRVRARVVQRVPRLVQERLVVVQPALRARDQVDDVGRVRGDDAGPRRFLRSVVEVEPDALRVSMSKPSRRKVSTQTGTARSRVYVASSGESRRM